MKRKGRRKKPQRAPVRAPRSVESTAGNARGGRPRLALWWIIAPVLALLAYRSASGFQFVGDARFLIADNAFVKDLGTWSETLGRDYFWSSSGQIIPYWRPATKLSWLLEWQWFGDWSGGYAWVNVAWHALGCAGVLMLARQIGLTRVWSLLVAVTYALHPVAIEPVSLIMARSDVVAAAASVWAVTTWRAWRRAGARQSRLVLAAAHVVFLLVALGSKEVSIVLPAVLALWGALEGDWRGEHRKRLATVAPSVGLGLLYFVVRRAVLERHAPGLSATAIAFDPLRVWSALAWYLRSAFPLVLSSGVREIPIAEAMSAGVLAKNAATLALFAVAGWWALRRRDAALGALLGWAVLGLAPVLLARDIAVPTAPDRYSLADRWLYYSLGPLLLAYALTAAQLWRRLPRRDSEQAEGGMGQPRSQHSLAAMGGVSLVVAWAVLMLARSTADRAELASDLAMLDNEDRIFYRQIPERFRTHWDDCRHEQRVLVKALMQGRASEAAGRGGAALERCPDDPDVQLYVLDALVQLRQFQEAEPLALKLVASPPRDLRNHGRLAFLAGVTLLNRGETLRAKPLLEKAVRLGQTSCRSFIALAEAAKARGRVVEAAAHLETAFQCSGGKDASLRVAAATWLLDAGEREPAHRALAGLRGLSLSDDQAQQVTALRRALGDDVPQH